MSAPAFMKHIETVAPDAPREEIIAAWLRNLRNPLIPQTSGVLINQWGMCCLGVLCATVQMALDTDDPKWLLFRGPEDGYPYRAVLPPALRRTIGFVSDTGGIANGDGAYLTILASMNDAGRSFSEIADTIEKDKPFLDAAAAFNQEN